MKTRGSEEALGKPEEAPERRRRGCRAAPKRPAGSSQEASHCSPEVVETSPKGSQEASLRCLIHVIVVFVANAVAVAVAVIISISIVIIIVSIVIIGIIVIIVIIVSIIVIIAAVITTNFIVSIVSITL